MPRGERKLTIIHFNDVYNIEPGSRDPVGGAARFVNAVKKFDTEQPLVLFSGDAFSPSLMSTITGGKQMVPVLNAIKVQAACLGNHDLDMGMDNFVSLAKDCRFPWLLANVFDNETGKPLAGARPTAVIDWHGTKVGLVGLAEGDWVETLRTVEPEDITYQDFVDVGRRLGTELREGGCDLVIALTHMRVPNDARLAMEAPEFDLVLGGHDHHYEVHTVEPHGTLLVKSGTDFREFTKVEVTLPPVGEGTARPQFAYERVAVTSDVAEDPDAAQSVAAFMELMGSRMSNVVGESAVDLDGRFECVRTRESNLANFICDVFASTCLVDCVLLNSGTFRSDLIHPAGPLSFKDLCSILPMIDETVIINPTGEQVLGALENGVSQYPKLEGRFPQVSGIQFSFDPSQPPGSRVVPGSVRVAGQPLDLQRTYSMATKLYVAQGKDGYDVLADAPVAMSPEVCPVLPNAIRNFFHMMDACNTMNPKAKALPFARRWRAAARARSHGEREEEKREAIITTGNCVKNPATGLFVIAPALSGRIVNVAEGGA